MTFARNVLFTPREDQLRRLLLDVTEAINHDQSRHAREPTVLRWAGGWVRDKLLGLETQDIDVAINNLTGVEFARRMCEYCESQHAIEKHGLAKDDVGNLHNVARNPDKSKHLETAMVRIFGLDIDFVNLRKEKYAESSRNPQVDFGSAEEDALRRDATINALFYNLSVDKIEDFTSGIRDLNAKLIRTPLEPLQTFKDDPLRVLRIIRFSSRLQFRIDPYTMKYMSDSEVLRALRIKISRERVGIELGKMMQGNCPRLSLELIDQIGLYDAIFTNPKDLNGVLPSTKRWYIAIQCLNSLLHQESLKPISSFLITTHEEKSIAWNLAAIAPWLSVGNPSDFHYKSKALPKVVEVAREGFKAPNKLSNIVSATYRHRSEITQLKESLFRGETRQRDDLGMAIRRWEAQGGSWRLQVVGAMLVDAMESVVHWEENAMIEDIATSSLLLPPRPEAAPSDSPRTLADRATFVSGWQQLVDYITRLDLWKAPSLKPLVTGEQLGTALGMKPGKWTGNALDLCLAWQLRNPHLSDPEEAIREVRANSHSLDSHR